MRTHKRSHSTDSAVNGDLARLFEFINNSPYVYNQTGTPEDPQEFDLWSNDGVPMIYLDDTWQELTYEATPVVGSAYVRRDGTTALTANWDAGDYTITNEQFTGEYLLIRGSDRLDSGHDEYGDSWQGSVARFWRNANVGDQFGGGVFTVQIADVIIDSASSSVNASHFTLYSMADIRLQHSGNIRSFYGMFGQARVHEDTTKNLLDTTPAFTDNIAGTVGSFKHFGSSTASRACGLWGIAHVGGTATVTKLSGVDSLAYVSASGATGTTVNAFWARQSTNVGTIGTWNGLKIDCITGGTLGSLRGIYIADITGGTSNYGIYFAVGTTARNQGICWSGDTWLYRSVANNLYLEGTSATTAKLHVKAPTGQSAVMQLWSGVTGTQIMAFNNSTPTVLRFNAGGDTNIDTFGSSAVGVNKYFRVYGYPTSCSLKYGQFQIVNDGDNNSIFQITSDSGEIDFDDENITIGGNLEIDGGNLTSTGNFNIVSDTSKLYLGASNEGEIWFDADNNLNIKNTVLNGNLILEVNDGSARTITLDGTTSRLKHSAGTFNFDDDDITSTGQATFGGSTAGEIPIKGIANSGQTANLLELEDSGNNDAFIVNKYGIPSPATVVFVCGLNATVAAGGNNFLKVADQLMSSTAGFCMPSSGCLRFMSGTVKMNVAGDGVNDILEIEIWKQTGAAWSAVKIFEVDIKDAAINTYVSFSDFTLERDDITFDKDDFLAVRINLNGSSSGATKNHIITLGVLLDDGTTKTTIS